MFGVGPPRPGLSLSGYGRAGQRRPPRLQLVFDGQRYQWHVLAFLHDVAPSQRRERPRLRFSVALPLGINGACRTPTGSLYPKPQRGRSLRGPQQRQLRASAAGGFGPRDPTGRKFSALSLAPRSAKTVSAPLRLRYRSAGASGHSEMAASTLCPLGFHLNFADAK